MGLSTIGTISVKNLGVYLADNFMIVMQWLFLLMVSHFYHSSTVLKQSIFATLSLSRAVHTPIGRETTYLPR